MPVSAFTDQTLETKLLETELVSVFEILSHVICKLQRHRSTYASVKSDQHFLNSKPQAIASLSEATGLSLTWSHISEEYFRGRLHNPCIYL